MEKWGKYGSAAILAVALLGVLPVAFCGFSPRTNSTKVSEKSTEQPAQSKPRGAKGQVRVAMRFQSGVYVVPVMINGVLILDFMVDSGASDVSIPEDVLVTLLRAGTVSSADFRSERTYVLANGSREVTRTILLRSLQVGDKVVDAVLASITTTKGSLLLGQSFLKRFDSWSIDNNQHVLVLK
jgi:clan AA aspartic protease (TIGR02281 family)